MSLRPLRFVLLLLTAAAGLRAAESGPASAAVRVVSQFVGGDELLLALAEPAQVAALSHLAREPLYSAVSREAAAYPQIGRGDAETILKFDPTLVLCADYSRSELVEQLRRAGVRVLIFDRYESLEDSFGNLRRLAEELGPDAVARAGRVIAQSRERVRVLAERLRGATPVRVLAPSTYGVVGGAGTTFQDLCDHAAADNLAASLGGLVGHQKPPGEQMLTWPVERVVLAGDEAAAALAVYRELPPYAFMAAIREGRVALVAPYMLSSVTHHRVDGYECLARALHPERFP